MAKTNRAIEPRRLPKLTLRLPGWPGVLAVLTLAFVVRYFFTVDANLGPLSGDAQEYFNCAANLVQHGFFGRAGVPDAVRPPLYPFLLAGVAMVLRAPIDYWLWSGLNISLDLLSVALMAVVGRRAFGPSSLAGVALVALSPLWWAHVNSPITEPLSVALFMLFLERWTRAERRSRDLAWGGLYLGLLTLARSQYALLPFFLAAAEYSWGTTVRATPAAARTRAGRADRRRRILELAGFIGAALVPTLLWKARNALVLPSGDVGEGGNLIVMAWVVIKVPLLDFRIQGHAEKFMNLELQREYTYAATAAAKTEALTKMKAELFAFIAQHPLEYAWLLLQKTHRLWLGGWWNPFPYIYSAEFFRSLYIYGFAAPVLGVGALGMTLRRRLDTSRAVTPAGRAETRLFRAQLVLVVYLSLTLLPLAVDARYSLLAYLTFGLWLGPVLQSLSSGATPLPATEAVRSKRAPRVIAKLRGRRRVA